MTTRRALIGGIALGFVALIALGLIAGMLEPNQDDILILGGGLAAVGASLGALMDSRKGRGASCRACAGTTTAGSGSAGSSSSADSPV